MQLSNPRAKFATPDRLWSQRREASLNWLALGLLLAAWNAADDDAGDAPAAAIAARLFVRFGSCGGAQRVSSLADRLAAPREFLSKGHKIVNVL